MNTVVLTGTVAGKIAERKSRKGADVAEFLLAVDGDRRGGVLKVVATKERALQVKRSVRPDMHVAVVGRIERSAGAKDDEWCVVMSDVVADSSARMSDGYDLI